MILALQLFRHIELCIPRESGDDPWLYPDEYRDRVYSPRERG